MGALQFVQSLAGAPHQALPLTLAEIVITLKLRGQLAKQLLLMGWQRLGRRPQLAAHEGRKRLTPALQVGEAPFRLEMQGLLQRPQPGLQREGCSTQG
jgi:hypothetical protein